MFGRKALVSMLGLSLLSCSSHAEEPARSPSEAQVEFKISYLEKVKELLAANKDAAAFTEALKTAYPELPGDADALAQALYKK